MKILMHFQNRRINYAKYRRNFRSRNTRIKPKSDRIFKVIVYKIKNPEMFAGKWANRNYFDGFTQSILKCHCTYKFLKTKDFEYQTDLTSRKSLKCFTKNDIIHFKFVQGDERFYIKRQIKGKTTITSSPISNSSKSDISI